MLATILVGLSLELFGPCFSGHYDTILRMELERWGVICKSCGSGIELGLYEPIGGKTVEWQNPARREMIPCPTCKKESEYQGEDFKTHPASS